METMRLYRLTHTGLKAWMSKDSGLPLSYRQILGLTRNAALADDICYVMRNNPRKTVLQWLDELETLCFVQAERISVARAA